MKPLEDMLVVELTRYLPGVYAGRELLRLGARVVRVEPAEGGPIRNNLPDWEAALNGGKESVLADLRADAKLVHALLARADVVITGFRPGSAERLGVGPDSVPERCVYCAITGFGPTDTRAGHDVNYMGWAGALEETAPALPPLPIADLGAGALAATVQILGALLERDRTGRGASIVVSMTHNAHELARYDDPTAAHLACYGIYACADGRYVTVGALEPKFFRRLCELLELPELADRQFAPDQEPIAAELAAKFAQRTQQDWLQLFDAEDAAVGPVATFEEAEVTFGPKEPYAPSPKLGEHTERWRKELGL